MARFVGLGNKVDVDETQVLEYYGKDPETKTIFIYLESFNRPKPFLEIASKVTYVKPIMLLKGGSTPDGACAAVAHTAALASDDRIIDGALKKAGVVRIYKYSHILLAAKALASMPLPRGNRVGFMGPSGAMLVILTDLCQRDLGLMVPGLEEPSCSCLQEISPPYTRMRNPVDIWSSAALNGMEYAYREWMEFVLKDPNIDAVVPILMLTEETGVPPLDFIVELVDRYPEKPIYITFSGDKRHMDTAKAFFEPNGAHLKN